MNFVVHDLFLSGLLCLCLFRLEEHEKLVTAEGLYRRALSLDDSNPEAQEALHKITDTIQVSRPHTHTWGWRGKQCVYLQLKL